MEVSSANLEKYSQAALLSLKEAALISVFDVALSVGVLLVLGYLFFDTLGLILLVEGAGLLLVGGALGFAGQPGMRSLSKVWGGFLGRRSDEQKDTTKKYDPAEESESVRLNDVKAAFYMLTGVLLFLESMTLAFLIR